MPPTVRPLITVVRALPDGRGRQGRRPRLDAMLGSGWQVRRCCVGSAAPAPSPRGGRNDDRALVRARGVTDHAPPWAATVFPALRRRDRVDRAARWGAWAQTILATPPAAAACPLESKRSRLTASPCVAARNRVRRVPTGCLPSATGGG